MKFSEQNFAVKFFKILSNANRLQILDLLSKKENNLLTVNLIAEKLNLEITNVSNHLVKLRENGILRAKQDGVQMHYEIKDSRVLEMISLAKKLS